MKSIEMKVDDAVEFFGSKTQMAAALNLTRGAISNWHEYVPVVNAWKAYYASEKGIKCNINYLYSEEDIAWME